MISFIILNYNTSELTLRCIRSIDRQLAPDGKGEAELSYEIIVVDNHSADPEWEALQKGIGRSDIQLFRSRLNVGFGAGNMLGANLAKGDFLCFLNSDVLLTEDCITPLCRYLTEHPDTGCITAQQYNAKNEPIASFNHSPGIRYELLGRHFLEKFFPAHYPRRKGIVHDKPFRAPQINGCLLLFPADKFWSIGGFDPNIFLYYEEYDVGMRLKQQGWHCIVHPLYRFSHLHGASTKKVRSLSLRELYISKMYCYRKHHNLLLSTIYRLIHIFQLCVKPHKWYILPVVLRGEALSKSMRHRVR